MPLLQLLSNKPVRTVWPSGLLLTLFMLANMSFAYAQDSILLKQQAAHKSREYISIDVQPLFRTGTSITRTTDKDVMKKMNTPGFSAGVDYQRVSQSGFTFVSGIHFRMIPVAYRFNIDYNDFPAGGPSISNFGQTNVNLVNGHIYFPIQAGYTSAKKIGKWHPSIMAGVNLSQLNEYGLQSGSSYSDDSHVNHPIQNIRVDFPEHKPWLSYTANVRASKTLRNGNQIFFGVNASFSGVRYNSGQYNLYQTSGKQSGTFSDTGSYVALQFGYSLVRRYKEPEKFNR